MRLSQLSLGIHGRQNASGAAAASSWYYFPIYGQSLALGNGQGAPNLLTAEAKKNITGATQANPVVVTVANHGYSAGDTVYIEDVGGMTELNNNSYEVLNPTTNTFELYDHDGEIPSITTVDGSAYTAYTSGGTAKRSEASTTDYMFNGGIRPNYEDPDQTNVSDPVYPDTMLSLTALTGRDHETPVEGASRRITGTGIYCTTARGAQAVSNLDHLGNYYVNTVRAAGQAKVATDAAGETLTLGPMLWKQGEADGSAGTSKADYKTLVEGMRADLSISLTTAMESTTDLSMKLISDQMGFGTNGYMEIAVALIELHRENANIYCLGPQYWHNYNVAINDVHLNAEGYRIVGEHFGIAMESIKNGNGWEPCHINSQPTRSGTTITVPIHVPEGALVKDTTLVASVADDGFTYSGASITSVTITDDGSTDNAGVIEIEIDAAAGGTLGYGYNNGTASRIGATFGPRGNIRDSSTNTALYDGTNLYNWLCIDQWTVS